MTFSTGPASVKHQKIIDFVINEIDVTDPSHIIMSTEVSHCEEGLTFVIVQTSFQGRPHILLDKTRQFMIKRGGKLVLMNTKYKSQAKTAGLLNVLFTETL